MFTLPWVLAFDHVDELALHFRAVLLDYLLGVGLELLNLFLVRDRVQVADVAVLVAAELAAELAEVF